MTEENIEKIRRKKLEQGRKQEEAKKAEEQLKTTLRVVLDENAYLRLMNVKIANHSLYLATAQNVLALYNRLGRKINDDEVLYILKTIKQKNEKEISITFERK